MSTALAEQLSAVLLEPTAASALEVRGRTNAGVLVPLYCAEGRLHAVLTRPQAQAQRGQVSVSASGGFGSGRGEVWLAPADVGSQTRFAVRVEVKIPFVGGRFEKSIAAGLAESIPEIQRFTTRWIAEHA